MKEIPPYCFSGCDRLCDINLHEGLTAIRRDALAETSLDDITFPHSLRVIDRGVFWECKRMKTISIPSTIESIGDFVFWHCDSLKDVYVESPKPLGITNIFQDLKGVRLHVPKGSSSAYKESTGWNCLDIREE